MQFQVRHRIQIIWISTMMLLMIQAVIAKENKMNLNPLTPEEKRVIVHKGTETAFTGGYTDLFEEGTYVCKRCNAPLYASDSKFHSGCGWPSFDAEIPGAVKRIPDADGVRTEIVCANCNAHLGHVFTGEHMTAKNVRHCVNSISMKFVPKTETAYFAGGCFWGVEYYFQNADGVLSTEVGYMGGTTRHPTYKQVCTGKTGHAETLKIVFDPLKTDFETLAKLFFEIHDPTQKNGQGLDIGNQYRSALFYTNEEQQSVAKQLIEQLENTGLHVVTHLEKATDFWNAEEYHQEYYTKTGGTPYCHARVKRFNE